MDDDKARLEKAIECKELARTKRTDIDNYTKAADIFDEIGNKYIAKANDAYISENIRLKLLTNGNYQLFEAKFMSGTAFLSRIFKNKR